MRESYLTRGLRHLCKTSLPWAGKTRNMCRPCCKKQLFSAFCNNFSQTETTWFVARQVWTWVLKRATFLSTRLAAMLQNKLHVFVACFTPPFAAAWSSNCSLYGVRYAIVLAILIMTKYGHFRLIRVELFLWFFIWVWPVVKEFTCQSVLRFHLLYTPVLYHTPAAPQYAPWAAEGRVCNNR